MKEKLAPIHFVQHNRIKIQENLEAFLVDYFSLQSTDSTSISEHGERTGEESLESQIDHDNIHGWLESHLVSNEKRMALLSKEIIQNNSSEALHLAHAEYGKRLADSLSDKLQFTDGQDLYNKLSAILLDGMPCDRINALMEASDHHLVWHSTKDIHSKYYEEQGLEKELFYSLRTSFLSTFLKTIGVESFDLKVTPELIVHRAEF